MSASTQAKLFVLPNLCLERVGLPSANAVHFLTYSQLDATWRDLLATEEFFWSGFRVQCFAQVHLGGCDEKGALRMKQLLQKP